MTPAAPQPNSELVDITTLRLDPQNVVAHGDDNFRALATLIEKHGQVIPIVVDPATKIIAKGNLTCQVMQELGFEEIWVNWVEFEDDLSRRSYAAGDNKVGELHDWRLDEVAALVHELQEAGESEDLVGFTEAEIEKLLAQPEPPSEFPEIGEDLEVDHQCPKCGYQWSGSSAVSTADG